MPESPPTSPTCPPGCLAVPGLSLITAILPRQTSSEVADFILTSPNRWLLAFNARGTLMRDHWYQRFLPTLSPEQEIFTFLVPRREEEAYMAQIIALAQLRLAGSGAVYSAPVENACFPGETAASQIPTTTGHTPPNSLQLGRSLVGIYCISQPRAAEAIARAAVHAGSHGPTIHYSEGRGLRDRLGLLRITQNIEKEFIQAVVDEFDAEPVFEAMVRAGSLDQPGRGFIYQMPISQGLVNLTTVSASSRHAASLQQVIHAIDELRGGADWRLQNTPEPGRRGAFGLFGRDRRRRYLLDMRLLSCIANRKHGDALIEAALAAGAPGASTSFCKLLRSDAETTGAGIRLNRERVIIKIIVKPDSIPPIMTALQQAAQQCQSQDHCFYTQRIPRALTYLS